MCMPRVCITAYLLLSPKEHIQVEHIFEQAVTYLAKNSLWEVVLQSTCRCSFGHRTKIPYVMSTSPLVCFSGMLLTGRPLSAWFDVNKNIIHSLYFLSCTWRENLVWGDKRSSLPRESKILNAWAITHTSVSCSRFGMHQPSRRVTTGISQPPMAR